MGKYLFIAEKPSVAQEFAKTLGVSGGRRNGFLETDRYIVTWCYGHLITMSYPEKYDPALKKWTSETLPFIPKTFKYEVIPDAAEQFKIVSGLLAREDVERIYVCTDSGREGEYIYRLVEMMADPCVRKKDRRRVWIDSFTEEEIKRGIREAKPESAYDALADSAYLRAKEDYLMGINFSRVLSIRYAGNVVSLLGGRYSAIAVGRVMTCVLGMVVRREREIRSFVEQPFFRVIGTFRGIEAEWRAVKGSAYENSPLLYKDNGFKKREDAETLVKSLRALDPCEGIISSLTRKTEKKNPPLLYNLAELQNDCSRLYRISPDQTLKIAQELYEKKLTTYPRTDARVLSTAVAKVISGNLRGLTHYGPLAAEAAEVLGGDAWKTIGKTRYTNDKAITDHYAIIPTGAGLGALNSLSELSAKVYQTIVRRFLAIFYPPAVYEKTAMTIDCGKEKFFANEKVLKKEGYLRVAGRPDSDAKPASASAGLRKGMVLPAEKFEVKEGKTSPPKRYTSGSMILAMENAGQLIEDDSLREQIRGSGIGTSATRADILAKLIRIHYLNLNKKTQVIRPELLGEMVYNVVDVSIRPLLNPELTASWEKGLTMVAEGSISTDEYMKKLTDFIVRRTEYVKRVNNGYVLRQTFDETAKYYKTSHSAGRPQRSARRQTKKRKETMKTEE